MSGHRSRMKVGGMTCGHCEVAVGRALEGAGARDVEADFRRGEAVFALPEGAGVEALRRAVREAGYEPGAVERVGGERVRGGGRHDYDLAIIGSGGGAFAAAIRAVERGARVAMIERGTVGGTCVNVGCVPSKTLLRGAEIYHRAGHHPFEGVRTKALAADYGAMVAQKDRLVGRMRQEKYLDLVEEYGWELIRGEAAFEDEGTLRVEGRRISAAAYLIATGARPAVPPIPGLEEAGYLTSTTNMELEEAPESVLVIGAGYVAIEQGQLLSRLGSRVTLMQRGPRLLREQEPEVSEAMMEALRREGIEVLTGVRIERAGKTEKGKKRLHLAVGGEERVLEGEEILVAAGRRPNVEELGLERAGVELDERGAVRVDGRLGTTNPRVWAAGDVTLGPQYVYVAAYEGALAADNALGGAGREVDLSALPGVIFSDPQVASVGLTERRARERGLEVQSSVLPLEAVPRALVNHDTLGVIKLVAEAGTGRLLGAHMVAENAGDVIYAATLAVRFGLTVSDLAENFAPYLTMSEGLKLAAQAFGRDVSRLSCCAA
ncbi:Mercuric reductase MerA [Rubrobacter xylanophilus DSM 9941]|uniref:Mercuric reductase n=2 Tax=Rubrobacter xylanophilus TaxID=49319 RepID=Q1AV52_RUBXD|nr:mercury(II) reductase [Rubrobacter xylanophilus]ABG04726.1 Mercuric reductase MerA [Rubrobacter xylanophilus DSM 9941]